MALPPPPPDRLFAVMVDGSNPLTWGEMEIKRNRIVHSLTKMLPESIVAGAIYGKNSVEWALCRQVCMAMGLRFSPINWHLAADEIAYIIDDCDADVIFFGKEYTKEIAAIRSKTPKVKAWVCMDSVVPDMPDTHCLQDLMNAAPVDAVVPSHNRQGGAVNYTGGTSGRPKGVLPGPPNPQKGMWIVNDWGMVRMKPHPIQLVSAPLYHAMPGAWLAIGVGLGCTLVLMHSFDARKALTAIQEHKVNGFYMPPILLKRLLQLPDKERSAYDLSTVKTITSSGAACPSLVKQGIVGMFGPVLHEVYGASELGGVTVMKPEHMLQKPLSCGKPATGMDVILLDNNKQKIEKAGVVGEIFSKGYNIEGYHKLEDKTKEAKFGDYMSVGDVGYFDEDGFLYITDRKIDMIVSGGANIYPAQVEEVLHQHPDIEDVAVFGVADDEYGERVHAALKPMLGRHPTAKGVLDWCSGKIGKFQLPKESDITFHLEDFPRSEAGKLRKKALKAQVERQKSIRSKL